MTETEPSLQITIQNFSSFGFKNEDKMFITLYSLIIVNGKHKQDIAYNLKLKNCETFTIIPLIASHLFDV